MAISDTNQAALDIFLEEMLAGKPLLYHSLLNILDRRTLRKVSVDLGFASGNLNMPVQSQVTGSPKQIEECLGYLDERNKKDERTVERADGLILTVQGGNINYFAPSIVVNEGRVIGLKPDATVETYTSWIKQVHLAQERLATSRSQLMVEHWVTDKKEVRCMVTQPKWQGPQRIFAIDLAAEGYGTLADVKDFLGNDATYVDRTNLVRRVFALTAARPYQEDL